MALLASNFSPLRNGENRLLPSQSTGGVPLRQHCLGARVATSGADASSRDFSGRRICFAAGTKIATPLGSRLIEELSIGDFVQTLDGGAQPVLWVGSGSQLTAGYSAQVRLAKGVLGAVRDFWVHGQQLMLFRDVAAELLFGDAEVLIAAQDLLGLPGVTQDRLPRITRYFHLLLPQHDLVRADGVISESMHPGPDVLQGLPARALADLRSRIPDQQLVQLCLQPAARRILMPHHARVLLAMLHQGDASSRIEVLLGLAA